MHVKYVQTRLATVPERHSVRVRTGPDQARMPGASRPVDATYSS